jgi:amidase
MAAFEDLSARELATAIRRKEISTREALDAHYARIDAINPALNAVVTQCRERAYDEAARADELTTSGADLPPLHGVPMTHKDTNNTRGIRTTQGSPVFKDFVPDFDDVIIERFRAAGVISTGKNNVPEFGAGSHSFNDVFGTTTNPYDPTRSAGGSSGGAAAAIAARIQPLGDGSDMGGSLRNPAAFCNVFGFRPSQGAVPMAPTRNAYQWLTRTGPIARSAEDLALAMSVLTGPDPRVPFACPADAGDFTVLLSGAPASDPVRPLAGLRVGLTTDFGIDIPVEAEIVETVVAQARVFEELGADVVPAQPDLSDADQVFGDTRAFDFAVNLGSVVAEHPDLVKPEVRWNVERGFALTVTRLMDTAVARTRLHTAVGQFFDTFDVLLAPTTQVLPFDAGLRYPTQVAGVEMTTYLEWMRSVCVISATGCPAISVPGGTGTSGLPVGLQLVAADGDDVRLLRVAQAYDQATQHADRAPSLAGTGT